MHKTPQMLCYGRDVALLQTRKMVLERTGFEVELAVNGADFMKIVETKSIHLIILCHSLDSEESERTLKMLNERWPSLQVILLIAGEAHYYTQTSPLIVNAMEGPRVLLSAVRQVADSISSSLLGNQTRHAVDPIDYQIATS